MQSAHQEAAVLVAAHGVTGDPDQITQARHELTYASLVPPVVHVVVLTRRELEAVPNGEVLAELLMVKLYRMKVHRELYEPTEDEIAQLADGSVAGGFRRGLDAIRDAAAAEAAASWGRWASLPAPSRAACPTTAARRSRHSGLGSISSMLGIRARSVRQLGRLPRAADLGWRGVHPRRRLRRLGARGRRALALSEPGRLRRPGSPATCGRAAMACSSRLPPE